MANYDLGALSYLEFELLIRDLLQEEWAVLLETFKSGKDMGIDIRYIKNGTTVIQCKHFFNSTYSNLKSHLSSNEIEKVKRLNPQRYVLATSVELNPRRKEELKKKFSPFCQSESDILGREDILNLLNRHEKIVKRHYKLWFSGTFVLQELLDRVVHNEIYSKTEKDLQYFQKLIPKIVITKSFEDFERIIESNNVCVICGPPGSGKTTLMKFFVLNYISNDYQPVLISENINEAFKIPDTDQPQIFYYDDFLGQTFFEKSLGKNEDNEILLFIETIRKQKNKKFVLSTREYVLKQAETKYEKIKNIEDYKFILNCSELSLIDKARILYNHLWHSQIGPENVDKLIEDKNYLKIIEHRNFNPRLIETMSNLNKVNDEDFIQDFFHCLDNPSEIWKETFEHKISANAQNILLILSTYSYHASFNTLWKSFQKYNLKILNASSQNLYNKFKDGLHELHDTFIKSMKLGETVFFDFHNPSIRDFIQNYLLSEPVLMNSICENCDSYAQIEKIWDILQYGCQGKRVDVQYMQRHINPSQFLQKIIDSFSSDRDTFPFFEHRLFHFISVASTVNTPSYLDFLNSQLELLIERNNEGHTQDLDALFSINNLIQNSGKLFGKQIDFPRFNDLKLSTKNAILLKNPSSIEQFKEICNYLSMNHILFNNSEIAILGARLESILEKGIDIDEELTIAVYNPDFNCFDTIGNNISGLEELKRDLEEISHFFEGPTKQSLKFVSDEIRNYYESHEDDEEDSDNFEDLKSKSDISKFQSDEIDVLFESLRDK